MSDNKIKKCKDCPPESKRAAPNPGPRCATHWRAVRATRKASAQARRDKETYGLPEGAYDALYAFQGGRCALCQRATGASKRLAVDHDHRTGEIFGAICDLCNRYVLGLASRRDPEYFRRCLEYLANPPARQLGLNAVHKDSR